MNLNKLTQRSLEALQSAQSLAIQHNHQQVDQEHLLLALLQQENSLLMQLLRRMGRDEGVISSLEQALQKTGVKKSSFYYHIKKLAELGYLPIQST